LKSKFTAFAMASAYHFKRADAKPEETLISIYFI